MAKLNVSLRVPQRVTIDSAKARMQKMLTKMAQENSGDITNLAERWDGFTNTFSFKAKGQLIKGKIIVGHNTVEITADLPFLVSFFKGQVEQKLITEGNRALQA